MNSFTQEYISKQEFDGLGEDLSDIKLNIPSVAERNIFFTVNELYQALQGYDLFETLHFATENFERLSSSAENLESFIRLSHLKVARHLMMVLPPEQGAGAYRKTESAIT